MASPYLDRFAYLLCSWFWSRSFSLIKHTARKWRESQKKKKNTHTHCSSATNRLQHRLQPHSSIFPKQLEKGTKTLIRCHNSAFEKTTIFWCKHLIQTRFQLATDTFYDVLWERRGDGVYFETTHAFKKDGNMNRTYPYPLLCQLQPTGFNGV